MEKDRRGGDTLSRAGAAGLMALGLALGVVAVAAPGLRDEEGFPLAAACGVASAGAASLLLGAFGRSWRRTAGWLALLLLGQALRLQLVDAGPGVRYEHLRPSHTAPAGLDGWLCAALAVEVLIVGWALARRLPQIRGWLARHLGGPRSLVLVVFFIATAAFPSRDLGAYGIEIVLGTLFRAASLGCVILALEACPSEVLESWSRRVDSWLTGPETGGRIDRLAWGCAAWVTLAAAFLAVTSYQRHPHVPDEVAYLFHASYFAEGVLELPGKSVPEAFETFLLPCDEERCFSPVNPGWPAALALGAFAGAPWLVNPLLGGACVLLTFLLVREVYDRRTARIGVLLLAASPWLLLVSMSFMTHNFSLFCALLAAWAVARLRATRRLGWGWLAGGLLGLVSLTRPMEGLAAASVLGLASLWIRGQRFRLAPSAALALGAVAVGSLVLPYNAFLTGDPLEFPIMAYADAELGPGANAIGFGPEKGATWGGLDPFPGHGLRDVAVNADLNVVAIDVELFGWATGSLLPVAFLVLAGGLAAMDLWMLLWIGVVVALHSLYWFSGGPDFGARYWYLVIVPCLVLTARALLRLAALPGSTGARSTALGAVALGAVALSVAALVNFVPWRAVDKYHHYRGMRPDMRGLLAEQDWSDALILVRGPSHPDYASAIIYARLDPGRGDPIIARDRGEAVTARLLDAHPDRRIVVVDGPSRTGLGYQVVSGRDGRESAREQEQ